MMFFLLYVVATFLFLTPCGHSKMGHVFREKEVTGQKVSYGDF